jgi:hypothetical protein
MILVAARHATPATYTPRDKQTRFSNETKNKGKITEISWIRIQKSMTYHNQTKELTTWYVIYLGPIIWFSYWFIEFEV